MSIENEEKLPEMDPVTFNYDQLRDETTIPALKAIYRVFAKNVDNLVFYSNATKEQLDESQAIVVQEMLEVIVANKVPDADMTFLMESFQATLYTLFKTLARQKSELEKEYLARSIGARDPGTGKFSREYAGLTELFISLENLRNSQDIEENQYFITKKKAE